MATAVKKAAKVKKSPVKINKVQKQVLVDERVVSGGSGRMAKIVLGTLLLGLAVAGGVLFYFLYYAPIAPNPDYMSQIVVPPKREEPVSEEPQNAQPAAEVIKQYVVIIETPTGYLNVRKGPGTNFAKIGEVKPGERYELVIADELKGWYEVRLADATIGWVSKQYSKVE